MGRAAAPDLPYNLNLGGSPFFRGDTIQCHGSPGQNPATYEKEIAKADRRLIQKMSHNGIAGMAEEEAHRANVDI